jgi:hypothetical protein
VTASAGWFVVSDVQLRDALRRAHEGDDPGLVLAELYANCEVERIDP